MPGTSHPTYATACIDTNDIVATQGQYLRADNSSPARFGCYHNPRFVKELTYALRLLDEKEGPRREIYGDEADESRLGHTPPETRARYDSKEANAIRSFMRTQEATTPPEERARYQAEFMERRAGWILAASMRPPLVQRVTGTQRRALGPVSGNSGCQNSEGTQKIEQPKGDRGCEALEKATHSERCSPATPQLERLRQLKARVKDQKELRALLASRTALYLDSGNVLAPVCGKVQRIGRQADKGNARTMGNRIDKGKQQAYSRAEMLRRLQADIRSDEKLKTLLDTAKARTESEKLA